MLRCNVPLNKLTMRIASRVDTPDPGLARRTFVRLGSFSDFLEIPQHQIIFGRRGTGKTHALLYLAETMRETGDLVIFIDLRQVGSSGGLYGDPRLPLVQRATQLLADILERIHEGLFAAAVEHDDNEGEFDGVLPLLDPLLDSAAAVQVVGEVEHELAKEETDSLTESSSMTVDFIKPSLQLKFADGLREEAKRSRRSSIKGHERPHVIFGSLASSWKEIARELAPRNVWILLDEWTDLPRELQPILADLIGHALLPLPNVIVKIGALEGSAVFETRFPDGGSLGVDLGSEIPTVLVLDDYLSTGSEGSNRRDDFFKELLFRHLTVLMQDLGYESHRFADPDELSRAIFADPRAFEEFVTAAEGVPRDGILILGQAALAAARSAIQVRNIRSAANHYFLQIKSPRLANQRVQRLLADLLDEVLGRRKSRTFVLRRDTDAQDSRIRDLFEARLIHLLRRGVTELGRPGRLYDVFSIDYGCYITTLTEEYVALLRDPWSAVPSVTTVVEPELVGAQIITLSKLGRQQRRRTARRSTDT
jgi:hypothetical protein